MRKIKSTPQRRIADSTERAELIADILKAVAHPLRIRIIAILCDGEQHVNGLAARLDVPQAIVSQQLRILRMRRLVDVSRENGFARYRILAPNLRALVECVEGCQLS